MHSRILSSYGKDFLQWHFKKLLFAEKKIELQFLFLIHMCSTSKASVLRQFCTEINKKQKKRPGLHPLSKLANCEISVCAYRDAHSCNCICPSHFHTESLTYPLSLILLQERSFMFYSKQTSEIKKKCCWRDGSRVKSIHCSCPEHSFTS